MGCCLTKDGLSRKQQKVLVSSGDGDISDFSLDGLEVWAKIVNVYDGDTFRASFFMKPNDKKLVKFKIRGNGYNSPELHPPREHKERKEEIRRAICSRNRFIQLATDCQIDLKENYSKKDLQKILDRNQKLVFIRFKKFEKFGRALADVYIDKRSKKSINQILIDEGHAVPYHGEGRDKFSLTVTD